MPIHSLQHDLNPDYQLSPAQVDVWRINLAPPAERAYEYLNHDEKKRADRFQFKHHQRRFTNARSTLKHILSLYLACKPLAIQIETHAYGKPYVNNRYQLEFNLSHSDEHALLAISQHHALGIDLEVMSPRPYHGIAKHLFSKDEQDALLSCPKQALPFRFFSIWTQKEAFIKACGLGLRYPTQTFSVSPKPAHRSDVFDSLHLKQWQLLTFMHGLGIPAALCCNQAIETVRFFNFTAVDKAHE